MEVNWNNGVPPVRIESRPYISCVSETWATATNNENVPLRRDPEEWTILGLVISDADVAEEDAAWLADDEM